MVTPKPPMAQMDVNETNIEIIKNWLKVNDLDEDLDECFMDVPGTIIDEGDKDDPMVISDEIYFRGDRFGFKRMYIPPEDTEKFVVWLKQAMKWID